MMTQVNQTVHSFRYLFKLRNEKVGFFGTEISTILLFIGARILLRTSEVPLAAWLHARF